MLKQTVVAMISAIVGAGIAFLALSYSGSQNVDLVDNAHNSHSKGKPQLVADASLESGSIVTRKESFPAGSPEAVVASYADASTWQERLPFVKRTPEIEEKMEGHYGHNIIHFDYVKIAGPRKSEVPLGHISEVHVIHDSKNILGQPVSSTSTYYLEKSADGHVILWEPSIGWLPIGWSPLNASRPRETTELQLRCKLTHNYSSISTKAAVKHSHFELEVHPDNDAHHTPLVAYVTKDSLAGKRIFQVLSDGREHPMVLGVQFRDVTDEDCVWVRSLASDRAYVYDDEMRRRFTSPIEAAQQTAEASLEAVPFEMSDLSAQWVINRDVLGGQFLVVPEVRFRVANASPTPLSSLRIKTVFVLKREEGEGEILYEDTQFVVSTSDRPLDAGYSKTVVSKAKKGYKVTSDNTALIAAIISGIEAEVEIYYETNQGFTKLQTIPVVKKLSE